MGLLFGLMLLTNSGCGDTGKSTLKGQLQKSDGSPFALQAGEQAFLTFCQVGESGAINSEATYPAMVQGNGQFEVIASGGELPPGKYRVALQILAGSAVTKSGTPKQADRLKGAMSPEKSKTEITVQPGSNDLQIKLPEGA
ncbi:hypothetical protein [Tuwongella immobilis]|uniref:hypothetical protein n=1 Tax=Tuwongella immobilis TaxID=692036 RepID=UPI0013A6D95A|nr:hypothetical protein [Tuwongella immobilis]